MGLAHKLHVIGNLISDDDTIAMIKIQILKIANILF